MLHMEGGLLAVQAKASDQPPNAGGFESPSQQKGFLGFNFYQTLRNCHALLRSCAIYTLCTLLSLGLKYP